jgi:ABC-type sugar transport system ATPase subunit
MTATVQLSGITKTYGLTTVLTDVDLTCTAGAVHALVGENGAGKSTLLKILTGSVTPDTGRLCVEGHPIEFDQLTPATATHHGIAIVHQEFALLPNLTVAENIYLGREPGSRLRLNRRAQNDGAARLLQRVGSGLDPQTRVEDISVADAQLVEIAKALSANAKVLALDEPSAVLSGEELQTLFSVVRGLRDQGVAVLYVSHRMDELFTLCDQYTVLKDGRVAGAGNISDVDRDDIVRMMVGRDVSKTFPPRTTPAGEPLLALQDFQVDGLPEPIALQVAAGEIVGVAGLGGSGRSRLLRGIFGLVPSRGALEIDGARRSPFSSPDEAMRAGIAFLPEDRKLQGLALNQSVSSNVTLLALDAIRRSGMLSRVQETVLASDLIARFGVKASIDGREDASALSGGNQQKVVLGKWLQTSPRLVLLDEPTRGIDVAAKEEIYEAIRHLADAGVGFLVVSSELIEVLGLSDRILVMVDGRIAGELGRGSTEEAIMRLITTTSRRAIEEAS